MKKIGLCRSTYYRRKKNNNYNNFWRKYDPEIAKLVKKIFILSHKTYGEMRIKIDLLNKFEVDISRRQVYQYMKLLGIKSEIRSKRHKYQRNKTFTKHHIPNLIGKNWNQFDKNQAWVTDTTLVKYGINKRAYLSVVKDVWSQKILSYSVSLHNDQSLVFDSVNRSLKHKDVNTKCIFHSDNALVYTSKWFMDYLTRYGFICSRSRPGKLVDNASCESFFSQIKNEWLRNKYCFTFEKLKNEIKKYIHFYNNYRITLKWKLPPNGVFSML